MLSQKELDKKIIKKAYSLIGAGRNKKKWTQGDFAKTKTGKQCDYNNENAACFCSLGAIYRAANELGFPGKTGRVRDKFNSFLRKTKRGKYGVVTFNDSLGKGSIH